MKNLRNQIFAWASLTSLALNPVRAAESSRENLSTWTLQEKIGQLFMVGFRSEEQLKQIHPGGVVLFSWNMKSTEAVHALTQRLRKLAREEFKAPLLVAIDHEGGQVLRLRKGLTDFPDAAAVGATGDAYLSFRVGKSMGQELSALGINMNLAPVLDLGNARSFLQNRIWGDNGDSVGEMTMAFIRGLQSGRVVAVAKHFPGHGRSAVDSHFGLPKLKVSEKELWEEDLEPFRKASAGGVQAVMTAHVEIPSFDTYPASLSKKFLTGLLREKIGFKGLVMTDDLEMGGVTSWGSAGDVALRALQAGSDMILIVWSERAQKEVYARLQRAVASGELPERLLDEKVSRILALKRQFLGDSQTEPENPFWRENLRRPESLELANFISKKAVAWQGGDFEETMKSLATQWSASWKVWLPQGIGQEEWAKFRPGDRIEVMPRRPDSAGLKGFEEKLAGEIAGNRPLLVVTGPRAAASEEIFQVVRKNLSRRQNDKLAKSTVIWVHQGSRPVDIKRDPGTLNIGLVSLYTSSRKGISAFLNLIKEGTARFGSLQSRNLHGNQLR